LNLIAKKPPAFAGGFDEQAGLFIGANDGRCQLSLPAWKLNTAPSLMPDGQREVTVFSLV
jgi:hypothetical protein